MNTYGQFCPVSKAMEVLDERWTLLVVRGMLLGSTRFNELRRGLPRMSPALLSKRLRTLQRAGVIRRIDDGTRSSYHLTELGRDLEPIVDALGRWGMRWMGQLDPHDLDPHFLFWDMKRTVRTDQWPVGRTTVWFELTDVPRRAGQWWFVVNAGVADACDFDPGFPVDARVAGTLRDLTLVWRGDITWAQARAEEMLTIDAPSEMRRALPDWFGHSTAADLIEGAAPVHA